MLSEFAKKELERQQYRIIGSHSAVKVCGWTKNMIKGEGGCYKLKFYGIMSNQCMQMTTSISCANRCRFCWRGYKAPVSKDWKWGVDDPEYILHQSMHQHHKLLDGFGGNEKSNKTMYEKSKTIKHVALSLTGEPIMYPKINELIEKFNREGISTFLVTNAQYPDAIRDLAPVTQLYISVDAPEKNMLKEIDVPLFDDYWERLNQSLEYMAEKKQRTCIRVTHVKGLNDSYPEKYAELIMKADPDFIEVKGYMHIGASRNRLSIECMPWHEEVVAFSKEIEKCLPEYAIVTEHVPSRVVMLAKKTYNIDGVWHTWIDFEKYHELANSGAEFCAEDYIKRTPQVGLSGRMTKQEAEEKRRKLIEERQSNNSLPQHIELYEFAEKDVQ
jgi:tRNA wybutosine-synthesizing protein 1